MNFSERIFCGDLSLQHTGKTVQLCGWVDAYRDHGGLLFIHLRDRSGIVQIVFSPEASSDNICKTATTLRTEYCIAVTGEVKKRIEGTQNPNIETGALEVFVRELSVLSESDALPFPISDKAMVAGAEDASVENVSEDLRLQYRYLDIRRPAMQENLLLGIKFFNACGNFWTRAVLWRWKLPCSPPARPKARVIIWCPAACTREIFTPCPNRPSFSNSF